MNHNIIHSDTIAALATPNGRGGIAVIKLSGPRALPLALSIFHSVKSPVDNPRDLIYGHIYDGGELVDEALLAYMPAPKSYTGEDVVELQTHGGFAVAEAVLALLYQAGTRPAASGEFTRRAFLNGRIDLVQAESVMEVVSAESREQLRQAEKMLNGRFSGYLGDIFDHISAADAQLALNIDFPDHDRDTMQSSTLQQELRLCLHGIDSLLQSSETVRRLRNGINVVLTGPVNSGKSSLFNYLLGRKRSLVNSRPGTTRDWIEERIELDGLPVNLIDTAGLRDSADEIEAEGITESRRLMESADVVLYLHDAADPPQILSFPEKPDRTLIIHSKADLIPSVERVESGMYTSIITGEGIPECVTEIIRLARNNFILSDSHPLLMVERHRAHLIRAHSHITAAITALEHWSEEIASLELHQAREEIQRITGANIDIDVLDTVFRTFCIGK